MEGQKCVECKLETTKEEEARKSYSGVCPSNSGVGF